MPTSPLRWPTRASRAGLAAGLFLLAALDFIACSGGDPLLPEGVTHVSGKRLRARVLDAGGGAIKHVGWTDIERGADCGIVLFDDDVWRCLPFDVPRLSDRFSDPQCTVRVHVQAASDPAPTLLAGQDVVCDGDTRFRTYRVSGVSAATAAFVKLPGGDCIAEGDSSPRTFYDVEAIVDDDIVSFTTGIEERSGDLGVEVHLGSDGSKALGRTRDLDREAPCWPLRIDDLRCLAVDAVSAPLHYSGDADCGTLGGGFTCSASTCPAPSIVIQPGPEVPGACTTTFTIHEAKPFTQAYSLEDDGQCVEATFGPCRYAPSGDEIPLDDFPALVDARVGTGRIVLAVRTALDDDRTVQELDFVDTDTDRSCHAQTFVDGIDRCVDNGAPSVNAGIRLFGDPSCTTPFVLDSVGACATSTPPYAIEMDQPDGIIVVAAPVKALYALASKFTGLVYHRDGAMCVAGIELSGWLTGAPIDVTTLAPITSRVE